jgi:oligopeptidase A
MQNPLLDIRHLPAFDAILPEHVKPAMDELLAQARSALEQAVSPKTPHNYDALSTVLDVATERLGRAWRAVNHLNYVADSTDLRAAYTALLPQVTEFYTQIGSDQRLYNKYKIIAQSDSFSELSAPRQKALSLALRNFILGGSELEGSKKERFATIQEKLAELSQRFSEHVLDATDHYAYWAQTDELAGVPEDILEATRASAQQEGKEGHKISLHFPTYLPIMQYAHNRTLRQTLYQAYVTRASDLGSPDWDNSGIMNETLTLRHEEAQLLGFKDYAELSLSPKMAQSPTQVIEFLHDLAQRARPYAQRDLDELREFSATELHLTDLQAWDIAYASEKLKEKRYTFSNQEVKQYFTEPRVLQGLFHIVQTVFEVEIKPDSAPVWHPDVRFYRVERQGELLAHFYLDLYARSGKRSGAWMDEVCTRWQHPEGHLQTPVAHLVCNFAAPLAGKPSLLTHDDVITLFHEFGHGLHLMLTQVSDLGVSGLSGVEWDAVELPSQFMENFCWEWEVLQHLTAHIETGDALPRALFDRMTAAKNFQSGLQTLRQIEFSLFDMRIHLHPHQHTIQATLDAVRAEISVLPPPDFNRFQHSFSHIFAGGYAAGYYSYKWAEVLSADAWAAFEESQTLSVSMGRRLRHEILERGGSRSALENFMAFRGREPRIDALLRHQGMAPPVHH